MKEPVKRTQEPAWRSSHWLSLGAILVSNDDRDVGELNLATLLLEMEMLWQFGEKNVTMCI